MMPTPDGTRNLSHRQQVFRAHGEWASRYIVYSLVACFFILGGALATFEYTGADDRARLPALILLATMIVINVVWRAAAEITSRIELMLADRRSNEPGSDGR